MNTTKRICTADEQGVLHLDLQVGRAHQHVEVVVVWQEVGDDAPGPGDEQVMADVVGMLEPGDIERQP